MHETPAIFEAPENFYGLFSQLLIERKKLAPVDLNKVQRLKEPVGGDSLPEQLIKLGLCADKDVADAIAETSGLERIGEAAYPLEAPLGERVSMRFFKEYRVVAVADEADALDVAVVDPAKTFAAEALQLRCNKPVRLKIGALSDIDNAIEKQFGSGKSLMGQIVDNLDAGNAAEDDIEHLKDLASEAPVIRIVNLIMQRAIEMRASDIHIEPFEQQLKVRLRVDGVLQTMEAPPVTSTAAVISRIKIMAKLNIAERRLPQDGRIKLQLQGKELDLRVSTIPTMYGESVVIRLLDKQSIVLDFVQLGFSAASLEKFLRVLALPHGIILITGPTGSGKTTTLYTALHHLNTDERKIITVEDPVEYQLEGINQIQAQPKIGLDFPAALRSIVRQDPDVIMIGEMRDKETASIAIQSALTGHLVLSTLHTNDAVGGIARLLDMGVEDYLLTSTINAILAQRLVRCLCPECKQAQPAPRKLIDELNLRRFVSQGPISVYEPKGCGACGGIGYRGRMMIVEILLLTDRLRTLIMDGADTVALHQAAVEEGMMAIYDDGLHKALSGLTSLSEVMRVTAEK
jgi:general secretion pathway protein E